MKFTSIRTRLLLFSALALGLVGYFVTDLRLGVLNPREGNRIAAMIDVTMAASPPGEAQAIG